MTRTLFDKVWDAHLVTPESSDTPAVLYIDLHLVHEVTSPQAFSELDRRGLSVRRPERTMATVDHSIPTLRDGDGKLAFVSDKARRQIETLEANCARHEISLSGVESLDNGVVHVVAPELGATHPGMTIVCGDSHTSTHGAFGALAFGIGTTEVGHVLATQCLLQRKPKTMAVEIEGELALGVGAKDLILAIIGEIGVDGGTGHVIEYRGEAIRSLPMEERMTLCNMSIEAGARAGLIAPDDVTFHYLRGRRMVPKDFAECEVRWKQLATDEGAVFDRVVRIDVSALEPQVSWGTSPEQVVSVTAALPEASDDKLRAAFDYTGLTPETAFLGAPIDAVFIGSCTNGRISDLRSAACILMGQTVAVRTLIVPGSQAVRAAAEHEGLDKIFIAAGAEWRQPGCSMCIAMNGDHLEPGQTAVSTSNRNFAGRQGKGSRTFLASPITAAASAIAGAVADPREHL